MIIYRPHRGSLSDAMKECKEFNTPEEMYLYISDESRSLTGEPLYLPEDIVIGDVIGSDDRIGWKDCRHVCVKRMYEQVFDYPICIGWCATEYTK